jgi:hypothetical protein
MAEDLRIGDGRSRLHAQDTAGQVRDAERLDVHGHETTGEGD